MGGRAKWATLLAAVFLVAACSNRTEQAQEILADRVAEKIYLEFQNLEEYPNGVVCGEYRNTDPARGGNRVRRFIVWDQVAMDRPSKQEWGIFCSDEQAAALMSTLGIGPIADEETQLQKIRDDLLALQAALDQYYRDNYALPSVEQGLAALVSKPSTLPVPLNFRPGGYLESLPADPWGRPYHFERSGLGGRIAPEYRLYTLGANGTEGGKGKNADVDFTDLKYLQLLGD